MRYPAQEEVQGDLNFSPYFDAMDINRDGLVTAGELQRYIEHHHGVRVNPVLR